ncbi:MAG: YihA family ribosome biogenesis GTP-binding protein [Deltaproteobacteria bacterium]|nr:YihA family ribosome biogenesis GTP-binding protein [Deltaproteobacteria bacterium]
MSKFVVPQIGDVSFIKGSTTVSNLPQNESFMEIAVAGRSNVGKSSLLQILFNSKKMVKVSRTPGRTREINFFHVKTDSSPDFIVADLPGYGYAKVPMEMREEWGEFISQYLETREQLCAVLLLFDFRRDVTDQEILFIDWLKEMNIPMIPVITKVDKIPKTHWGNRSEAIKSAIGKKPVMFSALKRIGVEDIWRNLIRQLQANES